MTACVARLVMRRSSAAAFPLWCAMSDMQCVPLINRAFIWGWLLPSAMFGLVGLQIAVSGRDERCGRGGKTTFADGFQHPFFAPVAHAHPCTDFIARAKASGTVTGNRIKDANADTGGFDGHDFPNRATEFIPA